MCFTLRLHMSAAPPQGGLTQALALMSVHPVSDPQVIGLLYDAAGILILGVPAVFRMSQEIQAQAGTYFDYNVHLAAALASSRIDLTVGSLVLLVGFFMQLAGNLGYVYYVSVGWSLGIGCLAFVAIYFVFFRRWLSNALLKRVRAALDAKAKAGG